MAKPELTPNPKAYINNRVDWQERDELILAEVKVAVQKLLAIEKPIRITVSRVAKAIGQLALVEQHLAQMPHTKAYLNSVIESIEVYQIRRVRWAAKLLDRRGESVDRWKVIRIAGLRPGYPKNVEDALNYEVEGRECNCDLIDVGSWSNCEIVVSNNSDSTPVSASPFSSRLNSSGAD